MTESVIWVYTLIEMECPTRNNACVYNESKELQVAKSKAFETLSTILEARSGNRIFSSNDDKEEFVRTPVNVTSKAHYPFITTSFVLV